jgi:hypothetical protein
MLEAKARLMEILKENHDLTVKKISTTSEKE